MEVRQKNGYLYVKEHPTPPELSLVGEHVSDGILRMPFSIEAITLLRRFTRRVPSWTAENYKFPGPWPAARHQKITTEYLLTQRRCWVLNGMRTGKTASTIWAIDILLKQGLINRVIVASPLSVVRDAWMKTFMMCAPQINVVEATGSTAKTNEAISKGGNVIVCNHDKLKFNYDALLDYNPDLVVIDEASIFRTPDSDLYQATSSLIIKTDCRLWALTASPTGNKNPLAVWPMGRLINPKAFPSSIFGWRKKVQFKITYGNDGVMWKNKEGWEDTVAAALHPSIRFRTQDCIDMPPTVMVERAAPMSAQQKKAFTQFKRDAKTIVKGQAISAKNAGVKAVKGLQILSGMVYTPDGEVEVGASGKLRELMSILDEAEGKVIVITPFVHVMKYVTRKLKKAGVDAAMIPRGSSLSARQEVFNRFQDERDSLRVIASHPTVLKYGVTLTAAHTTVWWAPVYDGEAFDQANMRMQGPKQHRCVVVMLYSHELERKLYKELQEKADVSTMIVDTFKLISN